MCPMVKLNDGRSLPGGGTGHLEHSGAAGHLCRKVKSHRI